MKEAEVEEGREITMTINNTVKLQFANQFNFFFGAGIGSICERGFVLSDQFREESNLHILLFYNANALSRLKRGQKMRRELGRGDVVLAINLQRNACFLLSQFAFVVDRYRKQTKA